MIWKWKFPSRNIHFYRRKMLFGVCRKVPINICSFEDEAKNSPPVALKPTVVTLPGCFYPGSARASFTSPRKSQSWRSLRAAWWLRSHTRLWWRAFHTSFHFVYFPFNEASSSAAYPLLSATAQSPTRPRLAEIKSSCPNWSQKFLSPFFHYCMSSVNGFIFWEVFGYVLVRDFFFFKVRFKLGVNNQDCNCENPQLGRKVLRIGCYMLLQSWNESS